MLLKVIIPFVLLHSQVSPGVNPVNADRYPITPSEFNFARSARHINYNLNDLEIEHFTAVSDGKRVTLQWKSCPEKKSDYFSIERSKDGINFTSGLIVKGSGHNNMTLDYTEIDYSPLSGLSYYRIKQTDYDGHVVYSPVVPVNFHYGQDGNLIAEIITPPEDKELNKIANKLVLVVLRDNHGIEHTAKVLVSKQKDQRLYALDTEQHLLKGPYVVIATSCNALYSQTLIIL